MKKFIQLAAAFVVAFALNIYDPAEGAQPVTSNVQISLAGTVFVPLSDGSFDPVALSGTVHVVTHVPEVIQPADPVRIQINLDQVFGVGHVTGFRYHATGAGKPSSTTHGPNEFGLQLAARRPAHYTAGPNHSARYIVHPYFQSGHRSVDKRGYRVDVGASAVSKLALTPTLSRAGGRDEESTEGDCIAMRNIPRCHAERSEASRVLSRLEREILRRSLS